MRMYNTPTRNMKNFNVKMYNEKMAELNNAIDIINDYLYLCNIYEMEAEVIPDFIQEWFVHPIAIFNDVLSFKNRFNVEYVCFEDDIATIKYVSDTMPHNTKIQLSLIKILPYIKEAYGTLFTLKDDWEKDWKNYDCKVIVKTKDAEQLIMQQCIEWKNTGRK